jgi:DNA-directed RNA polymerase sigma subunit (sigma70/sigma32)
MPPMAGPIPLEALEPALYSRGMTAQDVRALLRSSKWQALEFRNNQVIFLCEFAETNTTSTLSTEDIANIFNIRADNVRQIRHRACVKN